MSALTEEQRQNQHLADVAQDNVERLARGETAFGSERTRKPRKVEYFTGD